MLRRPRWMRLNAAAARANKAGVFWDNSMIEELLGWR